MVKIYLFDLTHKRADTQSTFIRSKWVVHVGEQKCIKVNEKKQMKWSKVSNGRRKYRKVNNG